MVRELRLQRSEESRSQVFYHSFSIFPFLAAQGFLKNETAK